MKTEQNASGRFSGVISVGKTSVILLSTQLSSILIRLIYLAVLARAVSPANYGVLAYGMYWYLVVLPFTYLGADIVLGREIGRDREAAPKLLGATLGLRCLAGVTATIVAIMLATVVESDPNVRNVVVIFSLSLLGRSLWMWSASVFTAFEEARPILKIETSCRVLEIAVLIILIQTAGADLRAIAAVHAASWLIEGVAAVALISRRWKIENFRPTIEWLSVIRQGLPGAAFAIAMAAFFQLPVVLFRQVEGAGDSLGYFALAFQIVTYLISVPYLAANAALPVLSRSAVRKDGKDRAAAVLLIFGIVLGGISLIVAASAVVQPVVTWLFGHHYVEAAVMLRTGLWLLIPASLAMLLQNLLFSNAVRSVFATAGPLIGIVVMIVPFVSLTDALGYVGALCSVAAGLIAWLIVAGLATVHAGFFKRRIDPVSPMVT